MLPPGDRAAFADALRAREREVIGQLEANRGSSGTVELGSEIGRLTRMDALQQQQMALHARRRLEVTLTRVRGALTRLDEGTFGGCALCKQPIARERLEFAPEMPFCIECQQRLEREGRI